MGPTPLPLQAISHFATCAALQSRFSASGRFAGPSEQCTTMPYFKTAQEWVDQSKLLLEARPATTRITTKYSIDPPKPPRKSTDDATSAEAPKPRGSLVVKTYDPESGVVLKYRTTKAQEVSRLIQSSLGRLGKGMAAVPGGMDEEVVMTEAPPVADEKGTGQAQSGGGGKKKKKGKK